MHAVATFSEHPVASQAVGECVGDILERGGDAPELLILSHTGSHRNFQPDIVDTTRRLLRPGVMVGAESSAISCPGRRAARRPGMSMFAVWHRVPSHRGGRVQLEPPWQVRSGRTVEPIRLVAPAGGSGQDLSALGDRTGTLLLFCDANSYVAAQLAAAIDSVAPTLEVVGGLSASGATGRGGLILDGETYHAGSVGALLPPGFPVTPLLSLGVGPLGPAMVVTEVAGPRVRSLDGRPALDVLSETLSTFTSEERSAAKSAMYLGSVDATALPSCGMAGAEILGSDPEGAVVLGASLDRGAAVRIHVGGPVGASSDLRRVLARADGTSAVFAFAGSGRSVSMFEESADELSGSGDEVGPEVLAAVDSVAELVSVGSATAAVSGALSMLCFGPGEGRHF